MDLEHTLRLACAPREPATDFEDTVMQRVSAASWRASREAPRKPGRIILVGSIVALAAAAGMLATQLARSPAQVSAALPAAAAVVADVPMEAAPDAGTDAAVDAATPAVPQVESLRPAAAIMPVDSFFKVLLRPLQLDTSDPAVEARAQEYYNGLLDELRVVPGLVLARPNEPAEFRITVTGTDGRNSEYLAGTRMWQVTLRTEVWRGGEYRQEGQGISSGGTLDAAPCASQGAAQPVRCGAAAAGARAVSTLVRLFPSSPAINELRARYRAEADAQAKNTVVTRVDLATQPDAVPAMDAEVIPMILERIATSPASGSRAALWLSLRGQRHPDLLPRLLAAARDETAAAVRKEVITQLALDYGDDPAARTVLTAVAATELQSLARHVAERAMSGDAPWRDHVLATLQDSGLSTAERLEPLNWMVGTAARYPRVDATLTDMLPALLDGDGARLLADLLVRTQGDITAMLDGTSGMGIVARLVAVDHPAVPELLVAYFDGAPSELTLRMLAQRRDDARVRRKLETIVVNDADPKLRQQAAAVLRQPAQSRSVPAGN